MFGTLFGQIVIQALVCLLISMISCIVRLMIYECTIHRFASSMPRFTQRWGTFAFAVPQVLNLMIPLRHAWNVTSYLPGLPDHPDAEQDGVSDAASAGATRSVAQGCDDAIRSDKFWAMCLVLEGVAHVLRHLLRWSEQCPCHGRLYSKLDLVKSCDDQLAEQLEKQWAQCPLRGNRAQELSSGEFIMEVLGPLHGFFCSCQRVMITQFRTS